MGSCWGYVETMLGSSCGHVGVNRLGVIFGILCHSAHGVILGSFWGHSGVILGPFGVIMVSVWGHSGVTLGSFGVILVSFWGHSGAIRGHSGVILGSFWGHVGVMLVSFWCHSGVMLGSCWGQGHSGLVWVHSVVMLGHSGHLLSVNWPIMATGCPLICKILPRIVS